MELSPAEVAAIRALMDSIASRHGRAAMIAECPLGDYLDAAGIVDPQARATLRAKLQCLGIVDPAAG